MEGWQMIWQPSMENNQMDTNIFTYGINFIRPRFSAHVAKRTFLEKHLQLMKIQRK